MLFLKKNPTIEDFLNYEKDLEKERGFSKQTLLEKCLLLGEEVGELFKAVRKSEGMSIDNNSKFNEISDEIADCFILLCAIANKYDINIEDAFRNKGEINKKRKWIQGK